ncbi:unnamed protein product [Spirodela intermedia]|uniref:Transcription repressor n=2 Tax=Spirodela intermedia TaxID=51605 RepID=A0A7I8KKD4_SPIIN|nr:unnamed protein product [Spirodela intermedia]
MGNHKFRMADMMPNAWFYKLKDMSKGGRKVNPPPPRPTVEAQQPYQPGRSSYYIPSQQELLPNTPVNPRVSHTHFPLDPPRKSKKTRRGTSRPSSRFLTSVSSDENGGEVPFSDKLIVSESYDHCGSSGDSSAAGKPNEEEDLSRPPPVRLPPILTKPPRKGDDRKIRSPSFRRSPDGVQGLRMRLSSPRLATKNIQAQRGRRSAASAASAASAGGSAPRKCLTQSFAVVKFSSDPQRDFRDSMEEMIAENNINSSKDLEDLLACYLSLNSNEYHDVIVKAFEQIWSDLTDRRRHESHKPRHCR